MEGSERAELIAGRLEEVLEGPLTRPPRRLSSGASRETWMFSAAAHGELVAQLDRRGQGIIERPPQAPLLRAAADAGVPVPAVVASGADDPVLGRSWIVLEAIPGTTDPAAILAADGADPARLVDSAAAAVAAIHRMPADDRLAPAVDDPVAMLRGLHDSLDQPHPVFEVAFRKLEGARPPSTRRGVVHGDCRLGNLIVNGDRVSGVLDWELTHIGDPTEDLGWLCVRAWRFGRPDRPAAGLGSREQLLAAYERHSGVTVDPDELSWWELFGTLRWGVITVMQADAHLSGAIHSVEHAVIGRRSCEVEWDLFELLDPGRSEATPSPPPTEPAPTLHDRPTAGELLDAARGALGDDVLPELRGRAAFQARVTMRALGIVNRELALRAEHAEIRGEALARLGVHDEAELAAGVRAGEFDDRERELNATLRALVRAKLEAANPRYIEETP
jgi:aminoglycoside phosphotransferase (APT) family kinase protein